MEIVLTVFIIVVSFVCFGYLFYEMFLFDKPTVLFQNKYKKFETGLILKYYSSCYHGKFKQYKIIGTYEILDRDGKYLWMKSLKTGKEVETNLYLDIEFETMSLETKDGIIIKKYNFD